jgi:hypothetical protein
VPVPAAAAEAAPARLGPLLWKFASAEAEVAPPEPRAPGSPLVLVGFRPAALPRDPDRIAAHLAGPASPAVAIEWVVEATLADGRELEGQRLFLVSEAGIGAADPATLEWVEIAPRALRACGASHPGTVLSTSGDTYRAFVVHGAGRWTTSLLVLPPGSLPAATRAEAAHDARLEALLRGERRGQEAWQEWVTPASWRP